MERVIIVGSAPGTELPDPRPGDRWVGANGGSRLIADAGLPIDAIYTTAWLFRPGRVLESEAETRRRMANLQTPELWLDVTDMDGSVIRDGLRVSIKSGTFSGSLAKALEFGNLYLVNQERRQRMIETAIGLDLGFHPDPNNRVSTGLFAACVEAYYTPEAEIVLVGINPGVTGHYDSDIAHVRHHVEPDVQAIRALHASYNVVVL